MSRYNCNNIIIVTNVIILEFLSARFVHPGALLPFCFFYTREHVKASKLLINKLYFLTTIMPAFKESIKINSWVCF